MRQSEVPQHRGEYLVENFGRNVYSVLRLFGSNRFALMNYGVSKYLDIRCFAK
ncbi:hypothetical protein SAMN05421829_10240 [Aromatoleum tolulyticum]|uniref:Uncharacterized protein n=1 Tax=Aromatoleum tolulyticum TaxID=34027 RepID=A0A1N6PGS3_9RHOO|nr:hypothetical protein SAMN05421829_10240 [Aromatoleum tolulyticum]